MRAVSSVRVGAGVSATGAQGEGALGMASLSLSRGHGGRAPRAHLLERPRDQQERLEAAVAAHLSHAGVGGR